MDGMTMTTERTTEREAGWIFEPTPEHQCILPRGRELDRKIVGSIWKCGTCGKEYEVFAMQKRGGSTYKALREAM
jgi:ribosomal protein L37AE/L43A